MTAAATEQVFGGADIEPAACLVKLWCPQHVLRRLRRLWQTAKLLGVELSLRESGTFEHCGRVQCSVRRRLLSVCCTKIPARPSSAT